MWDFLEKKMLKIGKCLVVSVCWFLILLMKLRETQVKKDADAQSGHWYPAFRIEARLCPWLGMSLSFYILVYRMQLQSLDASPSFSILPEMDLVLTVLPGCHVCAQFASGLQVRRFCCHHGDGNTIASRGEKGRSTSFGVKRFSWNRSESHWIPSSTPKLRFQCESFS